MHNQDNLVTLKEASKYLRYTYRGFWGRIRKQIKLTQELPAGVYNIAPEKSNKQILRVNLQEFLKGIKKHNISTKILTNTYENCIKGAENSYFSTLTKKTRLSQGYLSEGKFWIAISEILSFVLIDVKKTELEYS